MTFNETVFDSFPLIETERLILREITRDDIKEIFDIYSNPVTMKYFGKIPMTIKQEAEERIFDTSMAFQNKEGIRWGIVLKTVKKLIGSAGVWRIDRTHFRGEIGYDLLPEYFNKGIMTEALIPVIDLAFNTMNLHTLEANTDPDNVSSRKLLEKLGFDQEGYMKENFYFGGEFLDTVMYSLIKKEIVDFAKK